MKAAINKITNDDVDFFEDACRYGHPHFSGSTLDLFQQTATKSAIYPGQGTALGLVYVALKMNGEAGEFAEHVGKAMRDDGMLGVYVNDYGCDDVDWREGPREDRRELLIKEIGDVLWYLSAACNELGISLSDAALVNLKKLADRTERDALRGSGDER